MGSWSWPDGQVSTVEVLDFEEEILQRENVRFQRVSNHFAEVSAHHLRFFIAMEMEWKSLDRDDPLQGGVGCIDSAHLPGSSFTLGKAKTVIGIVAIGFSQSFQREVKGCRVIHVAESAGEFHGSQADVLLLKITDQEVMEFNPFRNLQIHDARRIADPHSKKREGRIIAGIGKRGIDQIGAVGAGMLLEQVDDVHGILAARIGPMDCRVPDRSADDGLTVSFIPVSGSDSREDPVWRKTAEFRADGFPMDRVEKIAIQKALDCIE